MHCLQSTPIEIEVNSSYRVLAFFQHPDYFVRVSSDIELRDEQTDGTRTRVLQFWVQQATAVTRQSSPKRSTTGWYL